MPKSRGRRPRRKPQRKPSSNRPRAQGATQPSDDDRRAAIANFPILRAVDAAEAEGDAMKAWQLIETDLDRRKSTERFWHPERLGRLQQLGTLDELLPRWATSRWILAQAVRSLHPSRRRPQKLASDHTVRIAGGPERYPGVDEVDSSCKLMDHDWVYRQLMLYEHGGLHFFLDHVASSGLTGRADRIGQWAEVPMGAFELQKAGSRTLRWLDLGSGCELETPNIGSAALLGEGEHAIGRLAPTEEGQMFESAPMFVPADLAARVAQAPGDWMATLEEGCHRDASIGRRISTQAPGFPLLSDVPTWQQDALVHGVVDRAEDAAIRSSESSLVDACVAVVRMAMRRDDEFAQHPFDPWPVVGSLLLEPAILIELMFRPRPFDGAGFLNLAERLAQPAARLCELLARRPDILRQGA